MGLLSFLGLNSRGKHLLEKKKTDPGLHNYLRIVRNEGANDDDIVEWWNLPEAQHRSLAEQDDITKLAALQTFLDRGLSEEEAMLAVRHGFPIYGDSTTWSDIPDDRPLPFELKIRVNNYFNGLDLRLKEKHKKDIDSHSSMNAYIRQLIKTGRL